MGSYRGRGTHGRIVELLGARIVSGAVPEGGTLDIRALGAELDISLTALREALKVLGGKGLVDARQKRGTFVTRRGAWNLLDADVIRWQSTAGAGTSFVRDLTEVRSVVEPAAARYAALRRSEHDLRALEAALGAMAGAGADPKAAAAADLAFHRALLAATGNEMLARMDMFLEPGLLRRDLFVHGHDRVDDPVPSHAAVLRAVAEGDPAAAEAAMLRLLAKSEDDYRRLAEPLKASPVRASPAEALPKGTA
jgi:DNA-binding FadR family transcriptional regulator